MKIQARIVGLGSYLPTHVLTNANLEQMVATSDEWITTRTGIKERRIASENEFPSDMGVAAAKSALHAAKIAPETIDLILVATMTPDYISPSTAALIQTAIGATKAAAVDVQAACTGFVYALSMAKAYIESGIYKTVLLIASEKMSAFIDYKDRSTCILFGDGAAAAVVTAQGHGLLIGHVALGADGSLAPLLMVPSGGARSPASQQTVEQRQHFLKMNGNELFKHAVRRTITAIHTCLQDANLSAQEISWLIPHQANERMISAISEGVNIPPERVYKTLHKYGNTSASSIAIALDELLKQQTSLKAGDHLLLVGFGGGLTWGTALLQVINKEPF